MTGLITLGIGPGGSLTYLMTGGLNLAEIEAPTDFITLHLHTRSADLTLDTRNADLTLHTRSADLTVETRE